MHDVESNYLANQRLFSPEEQRIADVLIAADQAHLFAPWPAPGIRDADKKKLLQQALEVEKVYPGGIQGYVNKGKELLEKSRQSANMFAGYEPSVSQDALCLQTPKDFVDWETRGLPELAHTAFVLVAGGLGERLGYKGIKVALPSELTTNKCYLQLYIEHILAFQERARLTRRDAVLPLGIMTSDDTDAMTRELLEANKYFGMDPSQVTVFKQGKVPALLDNAAHFSLEESDPFTIETKPHGHGDVHTLLYQHGLVERWVNGGTKWILFFQDTNGLVFRAVPAALGVSALNNLTVNFLAVPRVQGDAVGAIVQLKKTPGATVSEDIKCNVLNVEYNQLEGLLGKGVKEPLMKGSSVYSAYPGNINVLLFNAPEYLKVLQVNKGVISEFVNPKYKPNTNNTEFQKPTRLECMMQDYPRLLDANAKVSFTQFDRWTAFSAVKNTFQDGAKKQESKNAAECAATGEADMYTWTRRMLELAGVQTHGTEEKKYQGVTVNEGVHAIFAPSFGITQDDILRKFPGKENVDLSRRSTLVVNGQDVTFESLKLDGTLIIEAVPGAKVNIKNLTIKNKGWHLEETTNFVKGDMVSTRGYIMKAEGTDKFVFNQPGSYQLTDENKATFAVAH